MACASAASGFFDGATPIDDSSPLSLKVRKEAGRARRVGWRGSNEPEYGRFIFDPRQPDPRHRQYQQDRHPCRLLKEIDENPGNIVWAEFVNSNLSTGTRSCGNLKPNTEYRGLKLKRLRDPLQRQPGDQRADRAPNTRHNQPASGRPWSGRDAHPPLHDRRPQRARQRQRQRRPRRRLGKPLLTPNEMVERRRAA